MDNHELAEIDASLHAIVRRAYDLGRSEALKRVVAVLSDDRPGDQLALMPPEDTVQTTPRDPEPNHVEPSAKTPWWAWPVK